MSPLINNKNFMKAFQHTIYCSIATEQHIIMKKMGKSGLEERAKQALEELTGCTIK
jgi:hypothetical protein